MTKSDHIVSGQIAEEFYTDPHCLHCYYHVSWRNVCQHPDVVIKFYDTYTKSTGLSDSGEMPDLRITKPMLVYCKLTACYLSVQDYYRLS